ncbi:DIS3-like exonuclease 1 [Uloborus diversus]|uniref:DIS3-like exonuclease 1 n=1 Tax=Uloborus diversus TaxID=327109 RepID=UPI00240910A0|nr:DIS3-like exonuclease 1 [Uloborus diversus]
MLTKVLKRVKIKGRTETIIREQYLRDDVFCHSPLCELCLLFLSSKGIQLEKDASYYVIPCVDIIEKYLEILELQEIKGMIFLQSIVSKVMQNFGNKFFNRILNISKDVRRGSVVFLNEICRTTAVPRTSSDSSDEWLIKCCIQTAKYYSSHLNERIPVVILTDEVQLYESQITSKYIHIYSMKECLQLVWKDLDPAIQLYESLNLALGVGSVNDLSKSYDNYLPLDVLQAGIKSGRFFKGHLQVNKHNASQEAFVRSSKVFAKDSEDIYVCGMRDRNRAVHEDEVVVELFPKNQWKSRCMNLVDNPYDSKDNTDTESTKVDVIPTGRVVGVIERCWRNYVATLPEENEEKNSSSRVTERILVVPYDYCIPKIRIATKQAESLRNKRIVVRIDSWDTDSQYPNGHLVQALGEINDLETEVQCLLIEHQLFFGEFTKNLISELPYSADKPWQVDETEISKRKDLRHSHLIFSIDPKNCEDVDDALSVKKLPDDMLELGVHIADVTYFVKPLTLVDLEARSRSTSVYLPDRRYDMLPHILSGNLCSLLGSVDRYAVSVLWTLDSKFSVKSIWYGRTIIRSQYKLCYETAQDILCNKTIDEVICDIPELQNINTTELHSKFDELRDTLFLLHHIANRLRNERLHAGGLELSSINMKFEIDKMLPSIVSGVKASKELAIHKTVAECMIFANHWVAKKIHEDFPHQAVLRCHPNPREADLAALQQIASSKGYELNIHSNKDLASSLEKAVDNQDPGFNQILRILATQAMNQATYFCTGGLSVSQFYHYGLGLDKYTHFTSPIRRYADILVHRLLLTAVEGTKTETKFSTLEMEEFCSHLNMKHKAAQDIEKDAHQLYLAFYFEDASSKENSTPCVVDSIIYSFRANGMLVFVPKYGIKAAVCLRNKDNKVAIVNKDVQWVDGHLELQETCLLVHSTLEVQKYHIFDHITVCIKVHKSRSHPSKIVLELVENAPYKEDFKELNYLSFETLKLTTENDEDTDDKSNRETESSEGFNMYLFLEKVRMCSIHHQI